MRIKSSIKFYEGTRSSAFSTIFEIDGNGAKFKESTRFGSDSIASTRTAVASNATDIGLIQQFTGGHQYLKLNSVSISVGDLVKFDSNNQIIKTTSLKDTDVLGILWKTTESGSIDEYKDSFGNTLPENERDTKTIWKVASIGDSYSKDLEGFKVCNQGGNVSRGDLLCSSDTEGYLMKQPSEFVITSFDGDNNPQYEERQSQCSYTVAKAMEDVTFDSEGKSEGVYGFLYCG